MKTYAMGTYRAKNGQYSSVRVMWRKFVFAVRVVAFVSVITGLGMVAGALAFSTSTTVTAAPVVVENPAPVLNRIADCESGGGHVGGARQFNQDGSIVEHVNSNNTVDVGKYQINMNATNVRELAKLGLNPFTEEGNTAYAKWLYQNVGTSPWSSSAHCWAR